ncbi:MAG: 50S ribosomal protein L11 methyltransferase [Pseudomonadota bacterium]
MAWIQLRLNCGKDRVPEAEAALLDLGALSVTLEDRADQALLEPKVGETPLWNAVKVTALFSAEAELAGGTADLASLNQGVPPTPEILEDKDWSRAWMDHYRPMCFGTRLWICPSWTEPPEKDAINLLLDPGLAFGTGTHPSTAMCLKALDQALAPGMQVVDYGCGSGVLGVAAALLGANSVLCIDNDPQALDATRANANRNRIGSGTLRCDPPEVDVRDWHQKADLVVANILAGPLDTLAESLCDFLKPDGMLVLAGILESQADTLLTRYNALAQLTRELKVREQSDEWVCLATEF